MSEKKINKERINSEEIFSVISKAVLFSDLDEKEFNIVAGFLEILHLKQGEEIFKEGDYGKDMFIHLSGILSAFITQSDGTQRALFNITPGEFFGEMSIITHEPRSVTIIVAEDATTIRLSENDFYNIISDHPEIGYKMLKAINTVQNKWLNQTSKSVSDLMRWGETARKRAVTDEMTELYNRRFLEESIQERFINQSMTFRRMSLLMMDLDRIHNINDRHGTKAGDLVIMAAADMIRSSIRPGDIPARLSGDEFAILLPDTNEQEAAKIAERIRKSIETKQIEVPKTPGANETVIIGTRTSIGISAAPDHANTMEELEETSDMALRKAKELGRNRIEVYGF